MTSAALVPAEEPAPGNAVAGLLAISARLVEQAGASVAALGDGDRAALTEAARELATLARGYEAKVRALAAAGPLPAEARDRLAAAATVLRETLAPHERRLRAAAEAERRLIGCIAEAAREATVASAPYGRHGGAPIAAKRSAAAPVALCRSL